MKKLSYLMFLVALAFTACEEPGTSILYTDSFLELDAATTVTGSRTYSYLRVNDGQPLPSGFLVTLASAQLPNPVNFSFEVDAASTAVENLHYTISGNSGTIAANSSTTELPIMILDDNISPGEDISLIINLTSGDVAINPNYETATHKIQVICESNLAGVYDYATTNVWCGAGDTAGSVELIDLGSGTYTFSGWDFGTYQACYGGDAGSWGDLTLSDVCGTLAYNGSDNYGDTWTIDALDVNGADLTITWSNTYGEGGTTTLTRTDGSSWPDLTI